MTAYIHVDLTKTTAFRCRTIDRQDGGASFRIIDICDGHGGEVELFASDEQARPAVVLARPGLTASEIVGLYAIEPAPLNSGRHYRTIRIESAAPDICGKLTYVHGRCVEINGNGNIVSQSDRVRLLGFLPCKFWLNPLSAQYACARANDLTDRMIDIGRTLEGAAFVEHRGQYEAMIASHGGMP